MEHIKTTVISLRNGNSQHIYLPFEEVQRAWTYARAKEINTMKFPTGIEQDVLDYEVLTSAIIAVEPGMDVQVISKSNTEDFDKRDSSKKTLLI